MNKLFLLAIFGIVFISCSKEENQSLDKGIKKATYGVYTFSLSNCPDPGDNCCAAPAESCGESVDVSPSIISDLDDLVLATGDNTEDIQDFFDTNNSTLGIPVDLRDHIANASVLSITSYSNNTATYFKIFDDGTLIYVLPVY